MKILFKNVAVTRCQVAISGEYFFSADWFISAMGGVSRDCHLILYFVSRLHCCTLKFIRRFSIWIRNVKRSDCNLSKFSTSRCEFYRHDTRQVNHNCSFNLFHSVKRDELWLMAIIMHFATKKVGLVNCVLFFVFQVSRHSESSLRQAAIKLIFYIIIRSDHGDEHGMAFRHYVRVFWRLRLRS